MAEWRKFSRIDSSIANSFLATICENLWIAETPGIRDFLRFTEKTAAFVALPDRALTLEDNPLAPGETYGNNHQRPDTGERSEKLFPNCCQIWSRFQPSDRFPPKTVERRGVVGVCGFSGPTPQELENPEEEKADS
jgi:hypothetical protein